jgi:hypothetical protein
MRLLRQAETYSAYHENTSRLEAQGRDRTVPTTRPYVRA